MSGDPATTVEGLVANVLRGDAQTRVTVDQVPPIDTEAQKARYQVLASELYAGLAGPPDERARSPKGQLASALWQRVTEWDERSEDPSAD